MSPPTGSVETVRVDLGRRSYDIVVGAHLLAGIADHLADHLARPRLALVTDATVADLHLGTVRESLDRAGISATEFVVPPGEASKSFAELERLIDGLLAAHIERDDTIIALGGGVVGDLAGFAASILRRGARFIQAPTTLLAQVDSAVGGKTGINSRHGKNLVGSFYQPRLVLIDIATLDSLDDRQLKAGYAEIVKTALITDDGFFPWLEDHGGAVLAGDLVARRDAIARCCRTKAGIVARDEREANERALLNLGHTFAHAIEASAAGHHDIVHGEAVAVGLTLAFALSVRLGLCDATEATRVRQHLVACGLPTRLADLPGDFAPVGLIRAMAQDKKARDGNIGFVLARGIGQTFVSRDVAASDIDSVLKDSLQDVPSI